MSATDQQIPNQDQQDAILRVISEPRFSSCMVAAGHDFTRAWGMYLWNAKLGEAFHLPIQTVEVCLRNSVCRVLTSIYGPDWGTADKFVAILDTQGLQDLQVVQQRIRNRKLQAVNGQIVAGLSFGFWVSLLQPRYNPPIWGSSLRLAFPHLPTGKGRKSIQSSFSRIVWLRNRIWHHEPIIRLNVSDEFHHIMETIDWMCPHTSGLIRPHCRIGAIIREKP